ncbi:retrovirus-related pol polyprotein from transposon TNT 1-94 [Tanacetum coccineum]
MYLPQTNNQLRTSSNPRNQATVQDGRVVVQNVQGRQNRGQWNNARGAGAAGYGGAQNRVGNANPGQARQNSEYFKDKMLLMQAQENGVALDEEQLLFIVGGQDNTIDKDMDEQPVQVLALNVDNVFQADDCEAFGDADVDEAPTNRLFFIANLSSAIVFYIATNSELTVSRFTEMHEAHTIVQTRCLELEAELSKLRDKLKYQNLKESFRNNPSPHLEMLLILTQSLALDFQIIQLTKKATTLQEQNKLFRAENAKVKQHYKELYNSIKITRAKHIEQTTALTTKNENLKAQIHENLKCNTIVLLNQEFLRPESVETLREIVEEDKVERPLDRSLASACRVNSCTNVSGSQTRSNTKKNRISLAKSVNKKKVEEHTRTNKSSLKTTNRVDSIISSMRTVIQIVLWYLDSGCSKHMTGDRSRLRNFIKKFIGTVRFGNDYFGAIMVGQFCDSDLEVAFKKHSYYVRDTDDVELIKGSRGSSLYTISVEEMMKSSPICLLSKASKNKSWLWHRRLNHLNFGTINDLARKDLVRGLPRLKFEKDHLCSACQLGMSKKYTDKPKIENTNLEVLNTLHMYLCGSIRVQTINGKKYILVIVDDYSRFTWVKFLRSKDET